MFRTGKCVSRTIPIVLSLLLAGLTIGGAAVLAQGADDSLQALVDDGKIGQDVVDAVRLNGTAHVFIAVKDPAAEPAADGAAPTAPADLESLRASIADVQERVLSLVAPADYVERHRFKAVPALAGAVNEGGLLALAGDDDVVRIDLDVGGRGSLGSSVPQVRADMMADIDVTGAGVTVAVLDSGLDTDHGDLGDDLVHEECFLDNDGSIDGNGKCPNGSDRQSGAGAAEDDHGHGTNVTGIITSGGVVASDGVAPDAGIVAIKVLDNNNAFFFFSEIVAALDFIINNRPDVDVINMSLGTNALFTGSCDSSTSFNMSGAAAINTLRANGVIAFAAAGNNSSSTQMSSPACLSGVVAVGAVNGSDVVANFSNTNTATDMLAPGVSIQASGLANGTSTLSGTSQATPHAAGCAALFIESGIATTPDEIEALLEASSVMVTDSRNSLTFPRIDCNPNPLDVYFVVDLSGSFFDDLPVFKSQAPAIMSTVTDSNPNTRFGLGSFEDYPISPFGSASSGDQAYVRRDDLTFDTSTVASTISGLFTRFGADFPESQLPALYQAATGAGQVIPGFPGATIPAGQQASFRDGATKLFMLWTDATFHQAGDPGSLIPYPGPTFTETVDAILALDPPMVIGISSGGGGLADLNQIASATNAIAPEGGVDCNGDSLVDIAEGQPLVCIISSSGAGIGDAIVALIGAAAAIANSPPTANAGPDQVVECAGPTGAVVLLDGSASTDPDGDALTYTWAVNGTVLAGPSSDPTAEVTLGLGIHMIELTVDDGNGHSDVDAVTITVQDTTPPELILTGASAEMWPPNHAMWPFATSQLVIAASDICDADVGIDDVVFTSASSDEPADTTGDGATAVDIVIDPACGVVVLRAERQGGGSGRVYHMYLGVSDASGNVASGSTSAFVPHDSGAGAFDDGPSYSVTGCTP